MASNNIVQQLSKTLGGKWKWNQGNGTWSNGTGAYVERNGTSFVHYAVGGRKTTLTNIVDPKAKTAKPKAAKKATSVPITPAPATLGQVISNDPQLAEGGGNKLINNVVFLLDASSSMSSHAHNVESVFGAMLKGMSSAIGVETRISVYTFADRTNIQRLVFNQPIASVSSVRLRVGGMTAMIDATYNAITDHRTLPTPAGEDHSYLVYVLTDGEENNSQRRPGDLAALLRTLDDRWTIGALVPDIRGVHSAKQFGLPAGNIEVWNVNSRRGFEEAANVMASAYVSYADSRTRGVVGTKNLFKVDAANLSQADIQRNLQPITGTLFVANQEGQIRDIVTAVTGRPYQTGSAFYELMKKETVQAGKEIVIVNKKDPSKRYGGAAARQLLGLPSYELNVAPGDFGDWRIFVQSTSVNRKVSPGTGVYVR